MNLLVSIEHGMGWGDFMQRLISCLNFIDFVKKNFNHIKISFIIYEKSTNFLKDALNLDFLKSYVDEFEIRNDYYIFENFNCEFNGKKFKRLFSIFNHRGIEERCPGFWDVHGDLDNYDFLKALDLNAYQFGYRNISENQKFIPDLNFPVFNTNLYKIAKEFIKSNLPIPFESIYYRSAGLPNLDLIGKFASHLSKNLDKTKPYFLCSNISDVKEKFLDTGFNLKMIRPIESHNKNYCFGVTGIDEKIFNYLITEMVILCKSQKIHYCGDHYIVSAYNCYPVLVKGVELVNYDPILR